mmetsp:Transcript_81764/g.227700  ORF Transcript_81764/g.227700 Transcript_81764/m.227700 type:complete len:261 (-) Transcript_81764:69-851(-)
MTSCCAAEGSACKRAACNSCNLSCALARSSSRRLRSSRETLSSERYMSVSLANMSRVDWESRSFPSAARRRSRSSRASSSAKRRTSSPLSPSPWRLAPSSSATRCWASPTAMESSARCCCSSCNCTWRPPSWTSNWPFSASNCAVSRRARSSTLRRLNASSCFSRSSISSFFSSSLMRASNWAVTRCISFFVSESWPSPSSCSRSASSSSSSMWARCVSSSRACSRKAFSESESFFSNALTCSSFFLRIVWSSCSISSCT